MDHKEVVGGLQDVIRGVVRLTRGVWADAPVAPAHVVTGGPSWSTEPWLSKTQAAEHLGVTVRCLTNWQRDRQMPFTRVGGVNLYRRSELDRWAAARATGV
jgi:excisionase family DNA binding protein